MKREWWLHRTTELNHGYVSLLEECNGWMRNETCDKQGQMYEHVRVREVLPRKKRKKEEK